MGPLLSWLWVPPSQPVREPSWWEGLGAISWVLALHLCGELLSGERFAESTLSLTANELQGGHGGEGGGSSRLLPAQGLVLGPHSPAQAASAPASC